MYGILFGQKNVLAIGFLVQKDSNGSSSNSDLTAIQAFESQVTNRLFGLTDACLQFAINDISEEVKAVSQSSTSQCTLLGGEWN